MEQKYKIDRLFKHFDETDKKIIFLLQVCLWKLITKKKIALVICCQLLSLNLWNRKGKKKIVVVIIHWMALFQMSFGRRGKFFREQGFHHQ
jgi:hypothetical protein